MTRIAHLLLLVCVLAATTTRLAAAAAAAPAKATKHSLPAYRKKYPFVRDASAAPKAKEYDYIVVGGGATGCPLAATLSSSKSVLLLERGQAPWGVPTVERVDGFHHNLLYANNSTSVAQPYRTEDGVLVHRARVLGGGSAINAGFYTRASPAEVSMFGWDAAAVNTSYAWVEKVVAFKPVLPPWQSALKQALLVAGVVPDNGFTFDHVVGTKVGGVIFDEAGKRHTAADLLQYAQPRNIDVRIHATVHRILFDVPKAGGKPRATGVVYTDRKGVTHTATVKPPGEVILSAGAVGSPHLLQLSGIGPKEQLEKFGIPVLVNNPEVGQGMADNPNNVFINAGETPQPYSLVDIVGITDFGSYIEELSGGPNTTGLIQCFIQMLKDPSKVVDATYLPLVNSPPPIILPFLPQITYIVQKVAGPRSKGHLTLLSTDVNVGPSVRYNYYQDPKDLAVCVQAVKVISKAVRTPQFSKFNYQKSSEVPQVLGLFLQAASGFVPPQDTSNITALQQYCLDTVVTIWHAHGGCLVDKVVDHDRKVLGVDALRVIDISTINSTPGANPQATMMMLGRYMGLHILEERHSG